MSLTRQEQETVIVFNEADANATVFTFNGRMQRALNKLVTERPDEARHDGSNGIGGETYIVPKKWIKVRASRILSEEERAARVESAKRMVEKRKEKNLA